LTAPPLEYKDERSDDLRLHLFRGEVDLEAFQVIKRRCDKIGDFEVDAAIIGASHAVQVRFGDEVFTEVLACSAKAVDLYSDRLDGVWRVEDEVRRQRAPGLEYSFLCEVQPLGAVERCLADLREMIALRDGRGAIGLTFQFPRKTELTPETLLLVRARQGGLHIRSMHIYPHEEVAVVSDTSVTLTVPENRRLDRRVAEVVLS
jgi:hypothetical protein